MIKALYELLIPAVIAAVTSLVVSLIALYQFNKRQRLERELFDKELNRTLTIKLYELRLIHYPEAIEITDDIFKEKGGVLNHVKMLDVLDRLNKWKNGKISLIISVEARKVYFQLKDALTKKPACQDKYSNDQIENIIHLSDEFRKQLRRDLGFLYREEKQRRIEKKS